ncbi:MAG: response regulator [Desulfobulbaceae bacterium]|nr:response regulator [Desulfobulbaceae bacterium]
MTIKGFFNRLSRGGLLAQVSALALLTTTVILLFFGWQRFQTQSNDLTLSLRTTIETNSQWLATALANPLYNFDSETIDALCNSMLTFPDIVRVTINANDQVYVFPAVDIQRPEHIITDTISIRKSVTNQGVKFGEVQILASLNSLRESIRRSAFISIVQILILDFFLVAAIIYLLSRKFIIPVEQLRQAAEQIAGGDLQHSITIESRNELGRLAENLETMRRTLRGKISDLETEVATRRVAEKERELAKNYIDNIINSMPSLLIGIDSHHRVTQWNREAEKTTGIPYDRARGKDILEVFPRFQGEQDKIRRAILSKQVLQENGRAVEGNDSLRYEDLTIFPLITNGAEGVVIRIDDVTEEHQMRHELAHSRKLDAIGQLAGGVAHDFNNMLGGILGGAELLGLRLADDEKAKRYIEMIISSGQRAGDLTNKLLSFARKGKIESTPVDLSKAIDDAIAILEHSLDKRININMSIQSGTTLVAGDLAQLQNALLNLGLNAGHAMPDGGQLDYGVSLIELDSTYCLASPFDIQAGQYLDIEVRDTGVGIPPENLHQIYEPFFTTREGGAGSGLGLAAVYGTVQQHNGAITVYSEEGNGTIFHIYLPLAVQEDDPAEAFLEEPIHGSGKILVVDDEQVIRTTAKAILENLGYEVILADNGQHGLELFKKEHATIDLVIMDMVMPIMNGQESFFAMKEVVADVKIILASGFSRGADLEELKEKGLKGFIRKPYTTAELSRAIFAAQK